MDLFTALKERRSCRNFTGGEIEPDKLEKILEAGGWAPSVMNLQPWRFYVIKSQSLKERLKLSCESLAQEIFAASGWKWVSKYKFDFLVEAPVLIAVAANPKDTGADQFIPGRGTGYAYSCCAAVQNMLLAAHALGVDTLWFTLYDTPRAKEILGIPGELDLVSVVVAGYCAEPPKNVPRKPVAELTITL
ncbi:MAG: nitroreductase family protein [Syntrophomonadaceae bacterium]